MSNKLSIEKKAQVTSMLCEGASIRGIERITGINRNTIMSLGVRMGNACQAILDTKMRGLSCQNLQIDEAWGYIGSKQKAAQRTGNYGDVWVFIALDRESKLIPSFIVGKRDAYHANAFMDDLASRLTMRPQISSDSLKAYREAVERGFGTEADYGQIVKTYSLTHLGKSGLPAAVRYSPAEVVKVEKTIVSGSPDINMISTSHVENG